MTLQATKRSTVLATRWLIAVAMLCLTLNACGSAKDDSAPADAVQPDPFDLITEVTTASIQAERERLLAVVESSVAAGPFSPTADSLSTHQIPTWYEDAKFGVLIRWGPYAVPARWGHDYPRLMYKSFDPAWDYHKEHWGEVKNFGYKDFIPKFTATQFDPPKLMKLLADSGARFVVGMAEHFDGFAMYDSSLTPWNAAGMGPQRDVLSQLKTAADSFDMRFGIASQRALNWSAYEYGRQQKSDVLDPDFTALYGPAQPLGTNVDKPFGDDWLARMAELIEKLEPDLVWLGEGAGNPGLAAHLSRLAAHYFNQAGDDGVLLSCHPQTNMSPGCMPNIQRPLVRELEPAVWQADTAVSFLWWGFTELEVNAYKNANRCIDDLVDTISKNGIYLLGIGPDADGNVPDPERMVLEELGSWMDVNWHAVYDSRPWKVFGEGPTQPPDAAGLPPGSAEEVMPQLTANDMRFTLKGDTLYVFIMAWPEQDTISIQSLGESAGLASGAVKSATMLGDGAPLAWSRNADALTVELPASPPCDHAVVLAIEGLH